MIINQKINNWKIWTDRVADIPPINPISIGIIRSILALGTLITLSFSNTYDLFAQEMSIYSQQDVFDLQSINLFLWFSFEQLWIPKIIAITILIVVIAGWYPRWTGCLHWWVSFSFWTAATIVEGGDQVTANLCLILVPITLMDNRKSHWTASEKSSNFYKHFLSLSILILAQIQMAIIYLNAGVAKLFEQEWQDGTAVYYWMTNNTFGAPDFLQPFFLWFLSKPFFVTSLTWGTITWEIFLFSLITATAQTKRKFVGFAILFHFMILLIHGLGSFFFAMTGGLLLYLGIPKILLKPFENRQLDSTPIL